MSTNTYFAPQASEHTETVRWSISWLSLSSSLGERMGCCCSSQHLSKQEEDRKAQITAVLAHQFLREVIFKIMQFHVIESLSILQSQYSVAQYILLVNVKTIPTLMDGCVSILIIHFHEFQRIQFDCQRPCVMKKRLKGPQGDKSTTYRLGSTEKHHPSHYVTCIVWNWSVLVLWG